MENPDVQQQSVFEPNKSFVEKHTIHPLLFAGITLFVIFLLYQIGGGVISLIVSWALALPIFHPSVLRWSAVVGQLLFIFIPTLFFAKLFAPSLREVFKLRIPSVKESTFALLSLLALQWFFEVYKALQDFIPTPRFLEELLQPWKQLLLEMTKTIATAHTPLELVFVLIVVAIMPAIIEECLFRGLIQRTFEQVMSPFVAAVFSGSLFGVFHLNPFDLVPLVGIGIFLAMLRYRSHSLLLPIVAHFLNNAVAIFALFMGYDEESLAAGSGTTESIPILFLQLGLVFAIFVVTFSTYLKTTRKVIHQTPFEDEQ